MNQKLIIKILAYLSILLLTIIWFLSLVYTIKSLFTSSKYTVDHVAKIGDAINGITAPLISIIAAYLIYQALKAQIKANKIISKQFKAEDKIKRYDRMYSFIYDSIENFTFSRLSCVGENVRTIKRTGHAPVERVLPDLELKSGHAFRMCFQQMKELHHPNTMSLNGEQSVSEIVSILRCMKVILKSINKEIDQNPHVKTLFYLISHLYHHKIGYGLPLDLEKVKPKVCEICKSEHGIPESILTLMKEVRELLMYPKSKE